MRALRRGSVAHRVIEHLSRPSAPASLTAREIAALCGGFPPDEITGRLRGAIERGALVVERDGRCYRYRLPAPSAMAWTAAQALRVDDLPHRALMGERERGRRGRG